MLFVFCCSINSSIDPRDPADRWRKEAGGLLKETRERSGLGRGTMIRIFPDFSVQVTASAGGGPGAGGGGGGGGGGMVAGPQVGRVPVQVPGATNGTPQGVQGITAYQQRYVGRCGGATCS